MTVRGELLLQRAVGVIPQAHVAVASAGHQQFAVVRKGDGADVVAGAVECAHQLAGVDVVRADRLFRSRRRRSSCRRDGIAKRRWPLSCWPNWRINLPVEVSHRRMVRSSPAEARILPSGLNSTTRTQSAWPLSVNTNLPSSMRQRFTIWSSPAVASSVPSSLIATEVTTGGGSCDLVEVKPKVRSESSTRGVWARSCPAKTTNAATSGDEQRQPASNAAHRYNPGLTTKNERSTDPATSLNRVLALARDM